MDEVENLLRMEEQFWMGDAAFYRRHLSADALMVLPEPAGVLHREEAIESVGRGPRWSEVRMEHVKAVALTEEAVMLTYEAHAQRSGARYAALATSAYARRDGAWKLALHQQTPIAEGA